MLARVVGEVVKKPLLPGNRIEPLLNGEEAYPAMLKAITKAKRTISFSTYIFDRDEVGLEFAHAFGDAKRRGVEVRVLIDAAGTRYSFPTIMPTLRREKVRYARFLPAFALWRMMSKMFECSSAKIAGIVGVHGSNRNFASGSAAIGCKVR